MINLSFSQEHDNGETYVHPCGASGISNSLRFSLMKYILAHSAAIMAQQSNPYNGQNNQIVFLICLPKHLKYQISSEWLTQIKDKCRLFIIMYKQGGALVPDVTLIVIP